MPVNWDAINSFNADNAVVTNTGSWLEAAKDRAQRAAQSGQQFILGEDQLATQRAGDLQKNAIETSKLNLQAYKDQADINDKATGRSLEYQKNSNENTYNMGKLGVDQSQLGVNAAKAQSEIGLQGAQQAKTGLEAQDLQRGLLEKQATAQAFQQGGAAGGLKAMAAFGNMDGYLKGNQVLSEIQNNVYKGQESYANALAKGYENEATVKLRDMNNVAVPYMATYKSNPEAANAAMKAGMSAFNDKHGTNFDIDNPALGSIVAMEATAGMNTLATMSKDKNMASAFAGAMSSMFGPQSQQSQFAAAFTTPESEQGKTQLDLSRANQQAMNTGQQPIVPLSKEAQTKSEETIQNGQELLGSIDRLKSMYNPDFQKYSTLTVDEIKAKEEKANFSHDAETVKELQDFQQYRTEQNNLGMAFLKYSNNGTIPSRLLSSEQGRKWLGSVTGNSESSPSEVLGALKGLEGIVNSGIQNKTSNIVSGLKTGQDINSMDDETLSKNAEIEASKGNFDLAQKYNQQREALLNKSSPPPVEAAKSASPVPADRTSPDFWRVVAKNARSAGDEKAYQAAMAHASRLGTPQ